MNSYLLRKVPWFLAFSIVFLFATTQSCQDDIYVTLPKHIPLITVNSILRDGEPIRVIITSSHVDTISSPDSTIVISNAIAKFYEDDNFIRNLFYQQVYQPAPYNNEDKYFTLPGFTPRINHSYSITVEAEGFKSVSSTTIIPAPVKISSIDTMSVFTKEGQYTIKALECKIRFMDPPGIGNYYKLSIQRMGRFGGCDYFRNCVPVTLKPKSIHFLCYDLNVIHFKPNPSEPGSIFPESDKISSDRAIEVFFSDESFDGSTYELKVLIPTPVEDIINLENKGGPAMLSKIYFNLTSISQDHFKYVNSYFSQVSKRNDIFSEPVKVFTNITNGVGIFSGSSSSIDSSLVLSVSIKNIYK